VRHRREIVLDKQTDTIVVADTLECSQPHTVELYWHCHEEVAAAIADGVVQLRRDGIELTLEVLDPGLSARLAHGEEDEPLGWVSRRFDRKSATTTVVWTGKIPGSATLRTRIALKTQ